MTRKIFILIFITTLPTVWTTSVTPEKFLINVGDIGKVNENRNENKTIQKLVQDQTDIIKKIISSEKDKISDPNTRIQHETVEDLHKKCEQLKEKEKSEPKTHNHDRSTTETPNQQRPFNYFYITRNASQPVNSQLFPYQYSSSHKNNLELNTNSVNVFTSRTGNPPPAQLHNGQAFPSPDIKYVQLEPVMLQKMVLNDGQELLYWYRSPDLNSQYLPQVPETTTSAPPTSTPLPTQKITPHYEIQYSSAQKESPAKQQMKFVIPIQYPTDGVEILKRYPWEFDPYAYYPKPLQPLTVRVPVPYVPMFHMIRTLTIPGNVNKS
ncbi:uncharacterized protein LOC116173774 [Photinus pyralis]|uniref:uncharacterized protein LOC116173774 n=1 Tax=Photinus pyralis TaxID=7054 RepID=UPI0012670844|nr:uncharacterized protein LOC116173774 [Photinus pyralis]